MRIAILKSGLVLLLALALASCNLPLAGPTPVPTADSGSAIGPSATPPQLATSTSAPTDTPPPAAPTETPVPTATAGPNFAQASVYAVSHLSGNRLLVTIQIPGGVSGNYSAGVGTSTLRCEILSQYPDRLYCSGPEPYTNYQYKQATVSLYPAGSAEAVFQGDFQIPPLPTPTPTPTETPTLTPTP
ncbi:MAG: hypothetical protein WBR18_07355 [Anaerolineales bacterium]